MGKNTITVAVDNLHDTYNIPKRLDCGIAMLHLELGALAAGVTGTWEFLLPPRAATVSPPFSAFLCVVDAFYHALKKDSDSGRSEIQAPEQKTQLVNGEAGRLAEWIAASQGVKVVEKRVSLSPFILVLLGIAPIGNRQFLRQRLCILPIQY